MTRIALWLHEVDSDFYALDGGIKSWAAVDARLIVTRCLVCSGLAYREVVVASCNKLLPGQLHRADVRQFNTAYRLP